jgi:hypothetical protein
MDIRQINLDTLQGWFRSRKFVGRALDHLEDRDLDRILRNHVFEPIYTDSEVEIREAFDFLLSFYSILEIAAIARYIPPMDEIDADLRSRWTDELRHPAVRRYYMQHYPLALPDCFLDRLLNGDTIVAHGEQLAIPVMQYLQLTSERQKDRAIDGFLWLLDDGTVRGKRWQDLDDAVRNATGDLSAVTAMLTEAPAGPLDIAVRGLFRWIGFCRDLDALLRSVDDPVLRSAMWHHNAYWFERLQFAAGDRLHELLLQLFRWREAAERPEVFDARMEAEQREVRECLGRLMDQAQGRPLLAAADAARSGSS